MLFSFVLAIIAFASRRHEIEHIPVKQIHALNSNLVIYCYFEKNELYKDNFIFFLKHGILPENDHVIVINGETSVVVPSSQNLVTIQRTRSGFDFDAYDAAIASINKVGLQKLSSYKFIFFINTSVRGPFVPTYYRAAWYVPFIERFQANSNVKLVGTTINILPDMDTPQASAFKKLINRQGPFPHVQSMVFVLDRESMDYLLQMNFFDRAQTADFNELIASREIYLSHLILKRGWLIDCLIPEYHGIDFRVLDVDINSVVNPSARNGDPYYENGVNGRSIHPYEVIFMKTNRGFGLDVVSSISMLSSRNKVDGNHTSLTL
jgi:hypothetical protein